MSNKFDDVSDLKSKFIRYVWSCCRLKQCWMFCRCCQKVESSESKPLKSCLCCQFPNEPKWISAVRAPSTKCNSFVFSCCSADLIADLITPSSIESPAPQQKFLPTNKQHNHFQKEIQLKTYRSRYKNWNLLNANSKQQLEKLQPCQISEGTLAMVGCIPNRSSWITTGIGKAETSGKRSNVALAMACFTQKRNSWSTTALRWA